MMMLLPLLLLASKESAVAAEKHNISPLTGKFFGDKREWRFRVYLDNREIGYHHFMLEGQGNFQVVRSTADFEYKLLFVKLYEYQHQNSEIWQGDCLERIESSTDANGKPFSVLGQLQAGEFVVRGNEGEAILPDCVMSFAYWNPRFLEETRLLNSQNGEYMDVEISAPVLDELEIRGEFIRAYRYQLAANNLNLKLWYSEDHQWLGLESAAKGGRTLRYELL
jgi:hypothetical protein